MSRRELPERWVAVMATRGLTSIRRLADKANLGTPTVAGLIYGDRTSTDDTVLAVARALDLPPEDVYRLGGIHAPQGAGSYVPVPESARLSPRQRDALDELIRSIVERPALAPGEVRGTISEKKPATGKDPVTKSNVTALMPKLSPERAINSGPAKDDFHLAARSRRSKAGEQHNEHKGDLPRPE